jgi:hypothetical protein
VSHRYKAILDGHQKTGLGRRKWDFYSIMEEVLSGDHHYTQTTYSTQH